MQQYTAANGAKSN